MNVDPKQQMLVRVMARALGRHGLSGPFGHCSIRLDEEHFLVCAPRPMAILEVGELGSVVPVQGCLPEGVLGEVRLHQQVYCRRSDVGAIARFISPYITALAAMGKTPLPRHGFGTYFAPRVAFWGQSELIRDDHLASAVAQQLSQDKAIVLNVNGAMTVAASAPQALALAWFLEDAARVELAVMAAGQADCSPLIVGQQAEQRATWSGAIAQRVWDFLTHTDPEKPLLTHVKF